MLLNSPRGRAALKEGGIVWRLAMEDLQQDAIFNGPTEMRSQVFITDGLECYDDVLTDQELEIICGVYYVGTGHDNQASHKSWWPKAAQFANWDLGWWTPVQEQWYQQRKALILEGKADLKNGTQWRASLKVTRAYTKTMKKVEATASSWFDKYVLYHNI